MTKKKVIIAISALVILILGFLTWYKIYYSMEVVNSFDVNSPESKHRVLIATQGSEFKEAMAFRIIEHLKKKNVYIKVIDVTALPQINDDKWNAILVLHTWENLKPQADSKVFLDRVQDLSKVIVLSTSGNGGHKIEGVHAITSASVMTDIPAHTQEIKKRLNSILGSDIQK